VSPRARVEIGSGFGCVYVVTADGIHLSQVMPYQIAVVLREELAKVRQPQAADVSDACRAERRCWHKANGSPAFHEDGAAGGCVRIAAPQPQASLNEPFGNSEGLPQAEPVGDVDGVTSSVKNGATYVKLRGEFPVGTKLYTAPQPQAARPLSEWHEDFGTVTWWRFPVNEPPWVGTPWDSDWPGYHTHWTPAPPVPAAPEVRP
jgi:hypothetical protein